MVQSTAPGRAASKNAKKARRGAVAPRYTPPPHTPSSSLASRQPRSLYSVRLRQLCHQDEESRLPYDEKDIGTIVCTDCHNIGTLFSQIGCKEGIAGRWHRRCKHRWFEDGKMRKCNHFSIPPQPDLPKGLEEKIEAQRAEDNAKESKMNPFGTSEDTPTRTTISTPSLRRFASLSQSSVSPRTPVQADGPSTPAAVQGTSTPEDQLRRDWEMAMQLNTWLNKVDREEEQDDSSSSSDSPVEAIRPCSTQRDNPMEIAQRVKAQPEMQSANVDQQPGPTAKLKAAALQQEAAEQLDRMTASTKRGFHVAVQKILGLDKSSLHEASPPPTPTPAARTRKLRPFPLDVDQDDEKVLQPAVEAPVLGLRKKPQPRPVRQSVHRDASPPATPTPAARTRKLQPFPLDVDKESAKEAKVSKDTVAEVGHRKQPQAGALDKKVQPAKRARSMSIISISSTETTDDRPRVKRERADSPLIRWVQAVPQGDGSPQSSSKENQPDANAPSLAPAPLNTEATGKGPQEGSPTSRATTGESQDLFAPDQEDDGPMPGLIMNIHEGVEHDEGHSDDDLPDLVEIESSSDDEGDAGMASPILRVRPRSVRPLAALPEGTRAQAHKSRRLHCHVCHDFPKVHATTSYDCNCRYQVPMERMETDKAPWDSDFESSEPSGREGSVVTAGERDTAETAEDKASAAKPAEAKPKGADSEYDEAQTTQSAPTSLLGVFNALRVLLNGLSQAQRDQLAALGLSPSGAPTEGSGEVRDWERQHRTLLQVAGASPPPKYFVGPPAAGVESWTHDLDEVTAWYLTVKVWTKDEEAPYEVLLSVPRSTMSMTLGKKVPILRQYVRGGEAANFLRWDRSGTDWVAFDISDAVEVSIDSNHTVLLRHSNVGSCLDFATALFNAEHDAPGWSRSVSPDEDANAEPTARTGDGNVAVPRGEDHSQSEGCEKLSEKARGKRPARG